MMYKTFSFSQAKSLLVGITPPDEMWRKIQRDITHLPQDAIDSIKEWKNMYDVVSHSSGGRGIIRQSFTSFLGEIAKDILQFLYDYGYWVALFGGLTAILMYICGHRGALKWVWTLVIAYVFICAVGGMI